MVERRAERSPPTGDSSRDGVESRAGDFAHTVGPWDDWEGWPVGSAEHERKFLVEDLAIIKGSVGNDLEQGYLWSSGGWAIRARRTRISDRAFDFADEAPAMIAVKGPRVGTTRPEYNFPIEIEHASTLIALSPYKVVKVRHPIVSEGLTWEIDVFAGDNSGLVVAEIEMDDPDRLALVKRPWWAGDEVTHDVRYNNENLAENPWRSWRS